jgi:hypothetical protein
MAIAGHAFNTRESVTEGVDTATKRPTLFDEDDHRIDTSSIDTHAEIITPQKSHGPDARVSH